MHIDKLEKAYLPKVRDAKPPIYGTRSYDSGATEVTSERRSARSMGLLKWQRLCVSRTGVAGINNSNDAHPERTR